MILLLDNYDSFTYNLADYFAQLRMDVEIVRNQADDRKLFTDHYDAVVLSPGPGVPGKAGKLMRVVDYYIHKKPVLGICLGHQAIASYFEGKVNKAHKPMHGKTAVVTHNGDPLFHGIPDSFRVVRYHSLICEQLPEKLEIIAKTTQEEVMAIKHKDLPVYGLQFHPEAYLTDYGLDILQNWKNISFGHN